MFKRRHSAEPRLILTRCTFTLKWAHSLIADGFTADRSPVLKVPRGAQ